MMGKVTVLFFCALIPPSFLYNGDSCYVNNQPGKCRSLTLCPRLVNEVRRAGIPMPLYIRKKLQDLGCGFEQDQPLVCCETNSYEYDYSGENRRPSDSFVPTEPPTSYPQPVQVNNRGETNTLLEQPPDITKHPNLRLLPRDCGPIEGERIFGGNRTSLYEMPWMVLLSYRSGRGDKLSCGGTFITEWYVLTAAHCVSFLGKKLRLEYVILGEHDVRQDPDCESIEGELMCAPPVQKVSIDAIISHPGYKPQSLYDDIALVRLSEPADFSLDNMKAVCLPITTELQNQRLDGLLGTVAGWGATEDGLQSPVLLSVALPTITNRECQNIYNGSPHIYDRQICAGGVQDKDSCGGDSGGPLMYPGRIDSGAVRYVQHGIVSYGSKRCGIGGYPGVYTRLSYYMEWILDNLS